jgi:hypothetical protein
VDRENPRIDDPANFSPGLSASWQDELDLRAATGDGSANCSAGCGSIAGKFRQYSGSDASGKKQAPGALTLT